MVLKITISRKRYKRGGSHSMNHRNFVTLFAVFVSTVIVISTGFGDRIPSQQVVHGTHDAMSSPVADSLYQVLPGYGKKCWMNDSTYFTYQFAQRPKLGTAILKVQLFAKKGQKIANLTITGNSGMPSMRGAHDSGDVAFKQNNKGEYLLPVNIVMPGEWEVKLNFLKDQKVIYRGRFKFSV